MLGINIFIPDVESEPSSAKKSKKKKKPFDLTDVDGALPQVSVYFTTRLLSFNNSRIIEIIHKLFDNSELLFFFKIRHYNILYFISTLC